MSRGERLILEWVQWCRKRRNIPCHNGVDHFLYTGTFRLQDWPVVAFILLGEKVHHVTPEVYRHPWICNNFADYMSQWPREEIYAGIRARLAEIGVYDNASESTAEI